MRLSYLSELVRRLGSESPRFFKILKWASLALAIFSALFSYAIDHNIFPIEEKWSDAISDGLNYLTAFFAGSGFAATTATTNPALVDDKTYNNIVKQAVIEGDVKPVTNAQ